MPASVMQQSSTSLKDSQFDMIGRRPKFQAVDVRSTKDKKNAVTYTHHLYHHFNNTPVGVAQTPGIEFLNNWITICNGHTVHICS